MARPHRDLTTNDRFHVINRGIDGQDLFSVEEDWKLFESLIGRICGDYRFELNAYALMSNHYHFLVDLSDCHDRAGVSTAMGVLQSTYASYFNDRTSRSGPLFEPRFLGFAIDSETKTHRTIRYIHRNPIDICGPRALGAYRWSSLPVYLGRRTAPSWLAYERFAPNDPTAHLADLARCAEDDLWPLDTLPPRESTSLSTIERAVDSVCPGPLSDIDRTAVITYLARQLRAADVVAVAAYLDCSESKVRKSARQGATRHIDDAEFARLLDLVIIELARLA